MRRTALALSLGTLLSTAPVDSQAAMSGPEQVTVQTEEANQNSGLEFFKYGIIGLEFSGVFIYGLGKLYTRWQNNLLKKYMQGEIK
jgi:hypothetical protein